MARASVSPNPSNLLSYVKRNTEMKIVTILGTPRGERGSTAALLKIVLDGARSKGAETETISIKGSEIKPCRACNTCHVKGVCPQKDGFNAVKDKVLAANAIILATPNYIFHVSAQLKAFLDRCCGPLHCRAFEGKYGASVVTSGGGEEEPIAKYLEQFMARAGIYPVGSVWATMGGINGTDFPKELREKAFALGEKLVTAWKDKQVPQEFVRESAEFKERMRRLMLWRKDLWPYEYEFWKTHHGLS